MLSTSLASLQYTKPEPSTADLKSEPLTNLGYFIEWGGHGWERMTRGALNEIRLDSLSGKTVLDIGCRRARMACFFALHGATVVGIDHSEQFSAEARAQVDRFDVGESVELLVGDATSFLEESSREFDLIFTKSVLVVVDDVKRLVSTSASHLTPTGKFIAIENGRGNFVIHWLRRFHGRHGKHFHRWSYFDDQKVAEVGSCFDTFRVSKRMFPPIYTMVGQRNS